VKNYEASQKETNGYLHTAVYNATDKQVMYPSQIAKIPKHFLSSKLIHRNVQETIADG
jgi:hypothetical protein